MLTVRHYWRSMMSKHKDYWDKLQAAILINHRCKSTFRRTAFVREKNDVGETIWEGDVEVFDLIGGRKAAICYAWQQFDSDDNLKIFTILGNHFVYSANKAVEMALYTDPQTAVRPLHRRFAGCEKLPAGVR